MLVKLLLWYCWWYYSVFFFFPIACIWTQCCWRKKVLVALKFWKKWSDRAWLSFTSFIPSGTEQLVLFISQLAPPVSLDATMMLSATLNITCFKIFDWKHTHTHAHTRARACPIHPESLGTLDVFHACHMITEKNDNSLLAQQQREGEKDVQPLINPFYIIVCIIIIIII